VNDKKTVLSGGGQARVLCRGMAPVSEESGYSVYGIRGVYGVLKKLCAIKI
jgi:hypothetical protein